MVVMMFGYGSGWPAWGIALMWIGITAFLAFLIWAAYALITSTSRRPGRDPGPHPGSAARILDERLARGEIDTEEYRRLRDLIGSGRNDSPSGAGGARPLYPQGV
jgi:putative membrane protein